MAITCEWETKLATATATDKNGKHRFTFYGGGNCPFVLCYECNNGSKQMINFAIDKQSIKSVLDDEINGWRKLENIELHQQKDKTAQKDIKNIATALMDLCIPFKFKT